MYAYNFKDVNEAYHALVPWFLDAAKIPKTEFITSESRNGPVVRLDAPVGITYKKPTHRVLFDADRDANPFFHLYEAMWMLLGRNDVEGVARYVKGMRKFSDDGKTLHGAYGYRWRDWFGYDQLRVIAEELKENPDSRRCVLEMWDASSNWERTMGRGKEPLPNGLVPGRHDLYTATHGGKDVPCNISAVFEVQPERETTDPSKRDTMYRTFEPPKLNMTVYNRSNDLVLGSLGANYVHFSILQEYMVWLIGVDVGSYTQISSNLHLYTQTEAHPNLQPGEYVPEETAPEPMFESPRVGITDDIHAADQHFQERLNKAITSSEDGEIVDTGFLWLDKVLQPALVAHYHHRNRDRVLAQSFANSILCDHWKRACSEWLQRRYNKS